jgi:hypothetical protein
LRTIENPQPVSWVEANFHVRGIYVLKRIDQIDDGGATQSHADHHDKVLSNREPKINYQDWWEGSRNAFSKSRALDMIAAMRRMIWERAHCTGSYLPSQQGLRFFVRHSIGSSRESHQNDYDKDNGFGSDPATDDRQAGANGDVVCAVAPTVHARQLAPLASHQRVNLIVHWHRGLLRGVPRLHHGRLR